jgi:hypothetical protein
VSDHHIYFGRTNLSRVQGTTRDTGEACFSHSTRRVPLIQTYFAP